MKQRQGYLFLALLLASAFSLAGCSGGGSSSPAPAQNPPVGTTVGKTADLSGGQEVPPVTTNASGSGLLQVNTTTGTVSGSVTIGTAPTSTAIAAHVYEGPRGVNGSIVIVLENTGSGVWSVPSGFVINAEDVAAFSAGNLYFNIHTAANPNGEIRGQIEGVATTAAGGLR